MKSILFAVALSLLVFTSMNVSAHSGGTNAAGCHMNHKTGSFHCHTLKIPSSPTYCLVVGIDRYCGYAMSTCYSLISEYGGYCSVE